MEMEQIRQLDQWFYANMSTNEWAIVSLIRLDFP
jgi:hypothetical protein